MVDFISRFRPVFLCKHPRKGIPHCHQRFCMIPGWIASSLAISSLHSFFCVCIPSSLSTKSDGLRLGVSIASAENTPETPQLTFQSSHYQNTDRYSTRPPQQGVPEFDPLPQQCVQELSS